MNKNKLRTRPSKGLIVFLSIAIAISSGALVLFIIDRSNLFISILVYIFAGMFVIGGLVVLLDQLFRYIELVEDKLIDHIFFKKNVLAVAKITKVTLKKGMYEIYSKKGKFCSLPSEQLGVSLIMVGLQRQGIEFIEE